MALLKQSTAYHRMVLMIDAADHVSGKEGLTLTITASKDGGAFAGISPTVTERGDGWYDLLFTTTHTNTLGELALHIESSGADPMDVLDQVIAADLGVALATQSSVDTIDDFIDTEVAAILAVVDTEVAAIKAKTDLIPAAPAAVGDIPTANQNADALLDRANGIETSLTLRQACRLLVAADAGKLSGAATTTITIRNYGDAKDRIVATVDADGNRSALTYDLT